MGASGILLSALLMHPKGYDPKQLATAVRAHRKAAGLTQAELAEKAGLAFETISRIESGREPPSLRTAVSLANALSLALDVVVGRTVSPPLSEGPPESRDLRALLRFGRELEAQVLRHLVAIACALARRGVRTTKAGRRRRQ